MAWRRLLGELAPVRVLEIGCELGWNLEYLRRLGAQELYGVEGDGYAVSRARARNPLFNVLQASPADLPFRDGFFDLVFTCGYLGNVAPDELERVLDEMHRVSRGYIVAIEQDPDPEQEQLYRTQAPTRWQRDHGGAWTRRQPALCTLRTMSLAVGDGYDEPRTAHLFAKQEAP